MNSPATFPGTKGAQPYRMSADEYISVIEAGGFGDARVELFDGELIESSPFIEHGKVSPETGHRPYRVSAEIYLRMIDAGAFGDAHVELVDGELIEMSPSHSKHGKLLAHLSFQLTTIYDPLGRECFIDTVAVLNDATNRAPDICVVENHQPDQKVLLPANILLAVEIAGATLTEDLGRKRIDYASAGIRHYWVVDIEGRRIHTYADPQGADYAAIRVFAFGEAVPVPGVDGVVVLT